MTDAHPADTGRVQLVFKRLNQPRRHQRREGTWAGGCSAERGVTAAPRTLPYKALKPPLRPAPARGPLPPMRSCGAPIGRGRRRPPSPRGRDRGYNSAHRPVRGAAQRTAPLGIAAHPAPLHSSSPLLAAAGSRGPALPSGLHRPAERRLRCRGQRESGAVRSWCAGS